MKGFPSLAANFFRIAGEESWGDQRAVPQNRRFLPWLAAVTSKKKDARSNIHSYDSERTYFRFFSSLRALFQ